MTEGCNYSRSRPDPECLSGRGMRFALRSYAVAGFVPVCEAWAAEWNRGQPTRYAWLRHRGS